MKYLLCLMEHRYETHNERNIYTVQQPLQIFETREQAEHAYDLFFAFYHTLMVVREDQIDDEH